MSKELIRNGGFERGDTEFWESIDVTSIEVLAAAKKYGTYGCKVISSGAATGLLQTKDFFQVKYLQLLNISCWIKNSNSRTMSIRVYEFDSNAQLIGYSIINLTTIGTTHTFLEDFYIVKAGVSYIKIDIAQLGFASNEYSFIDSISLRMVEPSELSVCTEILQDITNETLKRTVAGSKFFTGLWKEAEYFFDLTSFTESVSGGAVTIDVKIQTYDPETVKWRDAMVFQQKSCPSGGSVTTYEYKRLTGNLGWKQRVVYTTAGAGTIGDCDFKVGVVYKR